MDFDPNAMSTFQEFSLDKLKEHFQHNISLSEFSQLRFHLSKHDRYYDSLTLQIQREFFGERRQDIVEVSFKSPLNWWQHFKESKFPKFLLKQFPVKYKTEIKKVELNRTWDFPDIPVNEMTQRFYIRDFHRHL